MVFPPKSDYISIVLHTGGGLEFQLLERADEMESHLVLKRVGNRGLRYLYSFRQASRYPLLRTRRPGKLARGIDWKIKKLGSVMSGSCSG